MIHQAPEAHDQPGTCWKLKGLLAAGRGLRLRSEAGMCQLLHRLKVSRKRARHHVHSPDPHYVDKLGSIRLNLESRRLELEHRVFPFGDEFSLYRHPSLASAYERMGKLQPLAQPGWSWSAIWRIGATLNAWSGQVTYLTSSCLTVAKLIQFYRKLVQTYPQALQIALAEDNWLVYFHPDLLAAIQPQDFPFGGHTPGN